MTAVSAPVSAPANEHRRPRKRNDPQIIVEGRLKNGPVSDCITFRMKVLIVELTFIVTIPPEGETKCPVYVKFRIDWTQNQPPGSVVIGDRP